VIDRLLGDVPPGHLVPGHVTHVVDRDVEPPERGEGRVGHGPDRVPAGDVRLDQGGLAAGLLDPLGGLLGALPRALVVHHHPRAFLGRAHRDLGAEPGPGPGDQDGAALELAREAGRGGLLLWHAYSKRCLVRGD
jgi:hypothetical protein